MGPATQALPSDPAATRTSDPPAESEQTLRRSERRIPTARETLATLPEAGEGQGESDFDFEPHDTIPAPPWLDDEIGTPGKTP